MNTAIDTQQEEQHLRNLLGQRSARTNTHANHGRLFSMSDLSDSPSIYSTAFFSPQTRAPFDVDTRTIASDYGPPRHEFDAIQRVILDDPTASAVDFSEDLRMSYASDTGSYTSDRQFDSELSDDEVRISMLGPKMRFHSRAPWETGEDSLLDENEAPVGTTRSKSPSMFQRGRGDNATKGSGPAARSRSKGPAEAEREQPKKSFDAFKSGQSTAMAALAKASALATSVVGSADYQNSTKHTANARPRLSLGRVLSQTPNVAISPISSQGPVSRSATPETPQAYHSSSRSVAPDVPPLPLSGTPPPPRSEFFMTPSPRRSHETSISSAEGPLDSIHPYANPELAPPGHPEVSISLRPIASRPSVDIASLHSPSRVAPAGDNAYIQTSPKIDSRTSRPRRPSVYGKEISSPISISGSSMFSRPSFSSEQDRENGTKFSAAFAGWVDKPPASPVALISLQEAQTMARERSRSVAVPTAAMERPFFPEMAPVESSDPKPIKTRMRSVSAGARAKQTAPNVTVTQLPPIFDRRGSEQAAPRNLKHKRSGFMRSLFNGKDKERSPPPPVPPLMHNNSWQSSQSLQPPKTFKSVERVPVPSYTETSLSGKSLPAASSMLTVGEPKSLLSTSESSTGTLKSSPSAYSARHRSLVPPSITIPDTSASSSTIASAPTSSGASSLLPHSAPSDKTDFQALSLRPVSTMFSTYFTDRIMGLPVPPHPVPDLERSPLTSPIFSPGTQASDFPVTPGGEMQEKNSPGSTIQALQEQIIASRHAWQKHVWDLEEQIQALKAELEELRVKGADDEDYCDVCGRGCAGPKMASQPNGIGDPTDMAGKQL